MQTIPPKFIAILASLLNKQIHGQANMKPRLWIQWLLRMFKTYFFFELVNLGHIETLLCINVKVVFVISGRKLDLLNGIVESSACWYPPLQIPNTYGIRKSFPNFCVLTPSRFCVCVIESSCYRHDRLGCF